MPFIQRLFMAAQSSVLICILAIAGIAQVQAAKPPPQPLSCTIAPDAGSTSAGVAITFTGSADGGAKGGKTYLWSFSDGSGSPAASSSNPVDVTYGTGGTYNVLLDVTDRNDAQASCSTTVTVSAAPGNVAPVAQNDEYNTQQDTLLSIPAPGVLGNDNDPDGDPMTAVLDVPVTAGNSTKPDWCQLVHKSAGTSA